MGNFSAKFYFSTNIPHSSL